MQDHGRSNPLLLNLPGAATLTIQQMLWNWNTIDACFVSKSWHINTQAQFAGTCIGVIMLVLLLELLRRAAKEYDRKILRDYRAFHEAIDSDSSESSHSALKKTQSKDPLAKVKALVFRPNADPNGKFRPGLGQQLVRATLHLLQFAVAYFIMLLAMYYNGFIIISIFIGAFLGFIIFSWEAVDLGYVLQAIRSSGPIANSS
jgi:copper transporter 1